MSWWARRRWWVGGSAVVIVVAGLVTWLTRSSGTAAYDPPARTRQYVAFTACLLTGPAGLADPTARAVWTGMESASSATRAQVSYLSVPVGEVETVGSVTPVANTLVQRHCGVIVAVGSVEVATARSVAAMNADARFVLVGGGGSGSSAGNVVVLPVPGASTVSTRVAGVVQDAVGGVFHAGVVS